MKGAIGKAEQLVAERDGAWMPQQFDNPANIEVHKRTSAQEILADFPEGLDVLITGVGTGGHITGVGETLKAVARLKTFAVEPTLSPVISGGQTADRTDPGHRRRVSSRQPAHGHARRRDPGQRRTPRATPCGRAHGGHLRRPAWGAALAAVAQKLADLPDGARVLTFVTTPASVISRSRGCSTTMAAPPGNPRTREISPRVTHRPTDRR